LRLRFLSVVFAATTAAAQQSSTLDTAQVRQWHEDLAFLRTEMPKRHANLFHAMTREQFDSALTSIDSRLPSLTRHGVIVELEKLDAMVGDGHSNVGPWRDSLIAFQSLPVAFYWFDAGLMIRAADSAHAGLIGGKVLELGDVPVDTAIGRVRPLISRDNEMGVKAYTPFLLSMPEILNAIGVSPSVSSVRLAVDVSGKRRVVMLSPAGKFPMLTGDIDKSWNARKGWVDARDKAQPALWLSDPMNMYWYRYLPEKKAMYVQINTIQQKVDDSISVFIKRAIATADSAGAEKLVLDLRLNGGGNGDFNKRIFLPIIKSRYDAPGRFYVLTGRRTFSAAQMLVTELMKYTNATFIGESTSSKGNHYGDSYRIVLPNSKVTVRVSTLWHQYLDSRDKREMIQPQIPVQLTFADYASGKDPILQAALDAPRPQS
jgi:hypothetical protein